jgi:peptidoglycan hydrolase-like protein with peptidoglycan-binding domain
MANLIKINKSVGDRGSNDLLDVGIIGAALTAVGPGRGGVFAPPLSIGGLAEAIRSFQTFQKLPARDGRVDPNGSTIKRINEILNPGLNPPFPVPTLPGNTGTIRPLTPDSNMATVINKTVWAPLENSLRTEWVFRWGGVMGKGKVHYFELDENVAPNWFAVLVPDGVTSFEKIHIFFHPTPGQVKTANGVQVFPDANYQTKKGWSGIFHYMSDDFAVQFCAANSGRVLIMPVLNQASAGSCGILPARWESLISQMLTQIASKPVVISSVVVSSFSSGITYSAAFRSKANLGGKLHRIIDLDGIFSTYKHFSQALPGTAIRMWQTDATPQNFQKFGFQNIFPLSSISRWEGGPYKGLLKDNKQIHGTIPQTMMHFAASLTRG